MGAHEMDPADGEAVQRVVGRARAITGSDAVAALVREMSDRRLATWRRRIDNLAGGALLGYKSSRDGRTLNLLEPAGDGPWTEMTLLNSLREVEAPVNLVLAGDMDDEPGRSAEAEADGEGGRGRVG